MTNLKAPNDLPVIVTQAGDYLTRCGGRATVHMVKEAHEDPTVTEFRVKGSLWSNFRGKYVPRRYTIWHVSGRGFPLREDDNDIVGVWKES